MLANWRFSLLLALLLSFCGLALVKSQYRARSLFIELESTQTIAKQLQEQKTQLLLEQSSLSQARRIEHLANEKLQMHLPKPNQIYYLSLQPVPMKPAINHPSNLNP